MPNLMIHEFTVRVPTHEEFSRRFPQYRNRARNENRRLFEAILQPESFLKAACANDDLELPAVAGVAKLCASLCPEGLGPTDKQFIGATVCALMEANGYRKTGQKRAIPHKAFTKGEVYERIEEPEPTIHVDPADEEEKR